VLFRFFFFVVSYSYSFSYRFSAFLVCFFAFHFGVAYFLT
jgi:hypothetical protein